MPHHPDDQHGALLVRLNAQVVAGTDSSAAWLSGPHNASAGHLTRADLEAAMEPREAAHEGGWPLRPAPALAVSRQMAEALGIWTPPTDALRDLSAAIGRMADDMQGACLAREVMDAPADDRKARRVIEGRLGMVGFVPGGPREARRRLGLRGR